MLTSDSYMLALVTYLLAGLVAILLMGRFWFKRLPPMLSRSLLGIIAGLLLTPAYPEPESATLAPALVVAIFNTLFGDGWSSAWPAFALLAAGAGVGLLIGVTSTLLGNKGRRQRQSRAGNALQADDKMAEV